MEDLQNMKDLQEELSKFENLSELIEVERLRNDLVTVWKEREKDLPPKERADVFVDDRGRVVVLSREGAYKLGEVYFQKLSEEEKKRIITS